MTPLTWAFAICLGILVLSLPRRLAVVPVLMAACYFGPRAVIDIGPATLSVLRIIVFLGVLRVLFRGERVAGGRNRIDTLVLAWAIVLLVTGLFHDSGALVYRAGIIWGDLGCYLLFRIFVRDIQDVEFLFKAVCLVLLPVGVAMLIEKVTTRNLFDLLGAYPEPNIRGGHMRARGPFAHPILAGTAGVVGAMISIYLWKAYRKYAFLGLFGSLSIVIASTSSGPLMMLFFGLFGLGVWYVRQHLRLIRWAALFGIIALDIVMKDPVYFLMARIDLTGSSQGYFRAQLIRSSINHLNEWWLVGTDYTRHWMATGIHANERHTDITNHILGMGVTGGLPLMIVFVAILIAAFAAVGKALRANQDAPVLQQRLIWTLGAIMFAHIANFFSISLFDQSVVFFYLVLGCIGCLQVSRVALTEPQPQAARRLRRPHRTVTPYRAGMMQR